MSKPLLIGLALGVILIGTSCSESRRYDDDYYNHFDDDTRTDSDTNKLGDSESYTGPPYDCDNLPPAPISMTELVAPRGFHDVAFDDEGHILGSDGNAIHKVTSDDVTVAIIPYGIGLIQGMDYLPDGDLVVASDYSGQLLRIDPEGVSTPFANDIYAFGVMVDPLGRVFAANGTALYRIDPENNEMTTYIDQNTGLTPRVVNFSPDHSRLYVGCIGGAIYYMELDGEFDAMSEPIHLTTIPGSFLDGLGVDACGNLYIPVNETMNLYRINPEGDFEVFYTWSGSTFYGHGLEWGTGKDGWNITAIYLPQPDDLRTVLEMEIGVPSRIFSAN